MKGNKPSKKKIPFQVSEQFDEYLRANGRHLKLPLQYKEMERSIGSIPLLDHEGIDTQ